MTRQKLQLLYLIKIYEDKTPDSQSFYSPPKTEETFRDWKILPALHIECIIKVNMDSTKQYKIALCLYTIGLDYDDRIRKEILSIQKLYNNVTFKIFALEPKNREESGVTSYGVPYRIPFLKTREKYASSSHTLAKAFEFYLTVKNELKAFDAIWCADIETFLFVLFNRNKPLLWDLHELPEMFIGKAHLRIFFHHLERKCKVMCHANEPRLMHLQQLGMVKYPEKQFFLRNYPQINEIDKKYDDDFKKFEDWLGEDKCVYLQGLIGENRADVECIGAVLSMPELKGLVVGRIQSDRMNIFEEKFGKKELERRIYFTGQIKQLKTPQFICKCCMALVFYKNSSANNWYCEPNRLFQNIKNVNPVIVGENPTMAEIVNNYGVGVIAKTDGSDQKAIETAMNEAFDNYDVIKANIEKYKTNFLWDSQEIVIVKMMEKFLK